MKRGIYIAPQSFVALVATRKQARRAEARQIHLEGMAKKHNQPPNRT